MHEPCEQREVIQQILGIVGALKELPGAIQGLRTDMKELMQAINEAAKSSVEHGALIAQNRRDIESLAKTDHEQWEELAQLGKRVGSASQRIGERVESLEKWQAGLNGGKPDGLATRLETLLSAYQAQEGTRKLWKVVPTLIAIAALVVSIIKI